MPSSSPPIQITKPEVFIIESLRLEDEENKRFEGRILADVLKICDKNPHYFYCRTKTEFELFLKKFRDSGYRYLHLSCHGNINGIETTLDSISSVELAGMMKGLMKNRRLFVSACEVGTELFSTVISGQNKGMYSIAAPSVKIRFDHAVAFWTSFYVKAFTIDASTMKRKTIRAALRKLCVLFEIDFHWAYYDANNDAWKFEEIKHAT